MSFQDSLTLSAQEVINDIGSSCVYTKEDTTQVNSKCITNPVLMGSFLKGIDVKQNESLFFMILAFTPKQDETIELDGVTWSVENHEIHGAWTVLKVINSKIPTPSRSGYRR